MVREKYGVRLDGTVVRAGKSSARVTTRARILLKTDDASPGGGSPGCGPGHGVPSRASTRGFAGPAPGPAVRKLDDRGEAHLIAAKRRRGMTTGPCACWRARWWSWGWRPPCPMDGAPAAQKNVLPWQKQEWCIPKVSADFVAHMDAGPVRRTL